MLNEESVKREVQSIKDRTLNEAIKLLSSYEGDLREYLADIIAALCGVSAETVRNGTSKDVYNAQVRWLYWYAYRYILFRYSGERRPSFRCLHHNAGSMEDGRSDRRKDYLDTSLDRSEENNTGNQ